MSTKLRSNPLKSCYNYVKELEEILSSLEHLLSHGKELGLKVAGRNRPRRSERHTPVADASDFCGREDIKETIIQSLRSAKVGGDKVSVIPVIGAGGLGKTTLVQIIYFHPEVKQLFGEVRAWVTVSTEFDLPTITKTIIEKVVDPSPIKGKEDQQELLFKLRDALKGKRFLLVLDDVWSEDRGKWNTLKSCFKSAESGSKIIVTTRSAKVASIMAPNQQHHFLQKLPYEDCLVLFAQTVFGDDEEDPDLQEIGEKIVRKCKGNPLSVVTVGGILCGERRPEKWEKILESSLWELLQKDNQDIIPSLWLSYLYLPSEIKPCFAYCSIFPKDHLFQKEEVVQLWMAEGFLQNEAGKRGIIMEEVGKRYFEELISRSLFQGPWNGDQCFIMHDLVHDLAMNVSGEFCFCLEGEKNLRDISCKTRYLSCNMAIQDVKICEGLSKAKRLHSYVRLQPSFQTGGDILKVLEELVMEGGCLRVLSLPSYYAMESLPDSIGDLKHLRYLNLSETGLEKLPYSIGTLYNLQTLLLSNCEGLTQLPDSIGDLKHLRYLNLSGTGLEKLPYSIGTLYNLQTLLLSNCEGLTELPDSIGNLKHLRDLNLSHTAVEKLPDSVGTFYDLQTLLLSDCSKLTQLPDSIGNLKHLRELDLSGSAVEKLPDSVGTLYDLQSLFLLDCEGLTQLPDSIGNLKHLRDLDLSGSAVEKLPDSVGTLYDLQSLFLLDCKGLTQLPDSIGNLKHLRDLDLSSTAVEKLPDSVGTLYNLQTLVLSNCEGLTELPDSIGNLKHLRDLDLSGTAVEKLPDSVGTLYNLQTLLLSGCSELTELPDSIGNLKHLRDLNLSHTAVEKLPDSVGTLYDLQTLLLSSCSELTELPDSIGNLKHLRDLNLSLTAVEKLPDSVGTLYDLQTLLLSSCSELTELPDSIGNLKHLRDLNLSHTAVEKLPDSVGTLYDLQTLLLSGCSELTELPDSIGNLKHLRDLNLSLTAVEKLPDSVGTLYDLQTLLLSSCSELTQLPNSIGNLKHMRYLNLSNSAVKKLPDSVGTLYDLQTLLLSDCSKLTQLPDSIGNLKHLRDLNLSGSAVEKLPNSVVTLYDLQTLLLSDCSKLTQLPDSIGNLKHLRDLNLSGSTVEKLPDSVGTLYDLQTLLLSSCSKLTQLPDSIGNLKHLRDLNLSGSAVEKLPDLVGTLYDLQALLLSYCSKLTQLPDSIGNLKHLRDLNLSGSTVEKLPDSVGTLYNLQTLLLSSCSKLTQLPDSIGNLKHLRDLNLSDSAVEKLPDSVGTLYDLQALLLSYCSKLTQLPSTMGSLINLHHLDTRGLRLEEMPPYMCNLTKLQTLPNFVMGKRGSSIRDLGALHNLNGDLRISGLQNVDDVLKGNMEDKKNLSKLVLAWEGQTDDSRKEKTVLDALQPHANLKELFIYNYGGTSFPDWLGDSLFSKIERMHLDGCQNCLFLPSIGRLPSLKELEMEGFHKLETIDDEFYGNDSPFKSLEVLHFSDMPEWKRWSVIEVPRLQKLKLKGCPKLVGGLPNCKTLTTLVIDSCPKLEYSGNQCCYPSLESLKIRQSCCYIRRLSLEHLTKLNKLVLTELDWLVELTGESSNEVKSLFIEKCPKLEFLGNSRYGSLEKLKIEQCEALNSIPLDYFPKLNGLTLRYCQNFESFRFGEETPLVLESLSFLKLKGLPKFVSFPEGGLPAPNLKDFHIEECENFRALPQQMHRLLPSLNSLCVHTCGEIESWSEGGLPSNLESLAIWRCEKLAAQVMHWDLQTVTPCLKEFLIDGCGEELLDSFPPEGLFPTSLTHLNIYNFRRLKTLNIHAFQNLKQLCVSSCDELQCLPEESLPNSVEELYIYRCPLLERRFRKETGEGWHKISHIPIVYINNEEQHEEQEL